MITKKITQKKLFFFLCLAISLGTILFLFLIPNGIKNFISTEFNKNNPVSEPAKTSCLTKNTEEEQKLLWNHFRGVTYVSPISSDKEKTDFSKNVNHTSWIVWFIEKFGVQKIGDIDVTALYGIGNIKKIEYKDLNQKVKNFLAVVCAKINVGYFKIDGLITHWNRFFAHKLTDVAWKYFIKNSLPQIKRIYQKGNHNIDKMNLNFLSLSILANDASSSELNTFQRKIITLFHQEFLAKVYEDDSTITSPETYNIQLKTVLDKTENTVNKEIFETVHKYIEEKNKIVNSHIPLQGEYINSLINDFQKNSINQYSDLDKLPKLQEKLFDLPIKDHYWKIKLTSNLAMENYFKNSVSGINIWKVLQAKPWLIWVLQNFAIKEIGGVWVEPLQKLDAKTSYEKLPDLAKAVLTFFYYNKKWIQWPSNQKENWWKIETQKNAKVVLSSWEEGLLYTLNKKVWEASFKQFLSKEMQNNFKINLDQIYGSNFSSWKTVSENLSYKEYSQAQNLILTQLNKSFLADKITRQKWQITSATSYFELLKKLITSAPNIAWTKVKNYLVLLQEKKLKIAQDLSPLSAFMQTNPNLKNKYSALSTESKAALTNFFADPLWEKKLIFTKLKIWSHQLKTENIAILSGQDLQPFWNIKANSNYQTSSDVMKKTVNKLALEPDWENQLKKLLINETKPSFNNLAIFLTILGAITGFLVVTGLVLLLVKKRKNKPKTTE